MVPFSDEFSDYDTNGDKLIAYEEFVFVVIKTVTLADPSQLREPFTMADANGDGVLDMDEFQAAPFLFAHLIHHQHKKEHIITRETVIGGDETVIGEEETTAAETYETTIVPKEDTTTIIALNNTENVSVNGDMSANQTDYALNYY
ncbi:uncharacterized protein LOC127851415 isoform X2 [Dreissena polymorpha]|uniref:EF-hand domain-containing protein n=2 Tax=Dreissena polymorpha TaxID=45954 RepID=A0A9D4D2F4_DREPO|nr:uncharacterized protein LOC127851415 isoform X2 [Dreissena polymorpha]KAH3736730.1 hypothetical protein DPMN_043303 [Dreissena polymorpha]